MVTTKLNLSMTEPSVRQIYAKQGDTGRVLDIALDQTPEDGTLRILRPDGVEVTSEAVTGGEVESGGTFESLTEADVTELTVGIEPVQDLHGYDSPWPAGGWKNKLNPAFIQGSALDLESPSRIVSQYGVPVEAGKTYTFSADDYTNFVYVLNSSATDGLPLSGDYSYCGTPTAWTASDITFTATNNGFVYVVIRKPNNFALAPSGVASVKMQFEEGSSATEYSPYSNICPITGHDKVTVTDVGKNLLDNTVRSGQTLTDNGVSCTINSDGSVAVSGTATSGNINAWFVGGYGTGFKVKRFPAGTYTFTYAFPFYHYVDETNLRSVPLWFTSPSATFTFTKDWWLDGVRCPHAETGSEYNLTIYPQIELGATATPFEPYQSNTYTTSLGQTVYGGTLDMVTGQLVVDRAMVTLDETIADGGWLKSSLYQGGYYMRWDTMGYLTGLTFQTGSNSFIRCSHAKLALTLQEYILGTIFSDGSCNIRVLSPSSTLAEWIQYIKDQYNAGTPIQVVQRLASPQTYTLTAQQIKTLIGTNNVWASSGDIANIKFTYGGLLSELPSDATSIVGKCYCDVEQNGVSSMPFTLNVKKNERQ